MLYCIRLEKENFKFSCSHFTIMSAESAERLHGHNYYVSVEIKVLSLDPKLGMAFDFNEIKPLIKTLTAEWDERVLLAGHSPYLKIERNKDATVVVFKGKRYEFPKDDVVTLPAVNITSEELARLLAENLLSLLKLKPDIYDRLSSIAITIEETRGQSVQCELQI